MPIYEYRCKEAKHTFELLRPMDRSDDPANCPTCGSRGNKVLSLFASFVKTADGQGEPVAVGGGGGCCGGSCGCGSSLN